MPEIDARIIAVIIAYALVAIGVLLYCSFMLGVVSDDFNRSERAGLMVLAFIAAVLWPLPAVFIGGCWMWRKARGIG